MLHKERKERRGKEEKSKGRSMLMLPCFDFTLVLRKLTRYTCFSSILIAVILCSSFLSADAVLFGRMLSKNCFNAPSDPSSRWNRMHGMRSSCLMSSSKPPRGYD